MSKTNVEYGLQGAFKMDTYDAEGKFVESTDWFSNFITQTGLVYPTIYSFANCFRFLTVGKDSSSSYGGLGSPVTTTDGNGNVHNRNPTTGCFDPIFSFVDSSSATQNGVWMGREGYETGTDPLLNSSCHTTVTPQGIRFFRAWQIPSGGIGTTVANTGGFLNIQELAVSPGSGGDPVGCFAFSRVARNLPLKNGYRAVVSYQLQVNCSNYALSAITGGTFNTGLADLTNDTDLLSAWSRLSGVYRQVWPGLSCVDSYGVSFIPKYGNGMEPSVTDLNNYYVYLSPDNSQFDVNNTVGGPSINSTNAWSSDGVMKPITQSLSLTAERTSLGSNQDAIYQLFYGPEQKNDTIPTTSTPFNIRLGGTSLPLKAANLANYLQAPTYQNTTFNYQGLDESGPITVAARNETISYATPGGSGMNFSRSNDTQEKAIFSTRMFQMPRDTSTAGTVGNQATGRKKNITRRALFTPSSSQGYNSRYGSMVFAYLANNDTQGDYTFFPIMDSLFYDTSGQAQLQHYRLISGLYLTERGSGIVSCTISIQPQSSNITRHVSLQTFQGPISGYLANHPYAVNYPSNFFSGGTGCGRHQNGAVFATGTSGDLYWQDNVKNYSGWGGIYGIIDPTYDIDASKYYDIGVAEHPTGVLIEPTGGNPSSLYWPYVHVGPSTNDNLNRLHVDFSNIVFSGWKHGTATLDVPGSGAAALAAFGWCRPTGYILHADFIAGEGGRLLAPFGIANINRTSAGSLYYDSSANTTDIGGALPALSLDNGMEIYFDIGWNSDCRGCVAGSCLDPTTMAPNP